MAREGWILVVGVSFDKKADEIVGALAPSFDTIICTAAHHKGADAESIAAAARKANPEATVRDRRNHRGRRQRQPKRSPRRRIGKYMWPADYSWRSNTPSSPAAAARRI